MTLRQALNDAAVTRMNREARKAYYAAILKLQKEKEPESANSRPK